MERIITNPKSGMIEIFLDSEHGNPYVLMALTRKLLWNKKYPQTKIDKITEEMASGDYDNIIRIMLSYLSNDVIFHRHEEVEMSIVEEREMIPFNKKSMRNYERGTSPQFKN